MEKTYVAARAFAVILKSLIRSISFDPGIRELARASSHSAAWPSPVHGVTHNA